MKWFMSYAYRDHANERLHLGSHVTTIHPISVIEDWNFAYDDRQHVLISFQELPEEPLQRVPEHDCDIIANYL